MSKRHFSVVWDDEMGGPRPVRPEEANLPALYDINVDYYRFVRQSDIDDMQRCIRRLANKVSSHG